MLPKTIVTDDDAADDDDSHDLAYAQTKGNKVDPTVQEVTLMSELVG